MAAEVSPRFKRFIDDVSGRAYIHDAETGEVGWELPDEDWINLTDKATGRTFWDNQKTKRSQWENPAFRVLDEMNESDSEPENSEVDKWRCYEDSKTGRLYWHNSATGESSWSKPAKSLKKRQDSVSLGVHPESQWEKFWDPNTRRVFFFHRQLGITQWERPMELGTWSPSTESISGQKEPRDKGSRVSAVARKLFQEDKNGDERFAPSSERAEVGTSSAQRSPIDDKLEHKPDVPRNIFNNNKESPSASDMAGEGGANKVCELSPSKSTSGSSRSPIVGSSSSDDVSHASPGACNQHVVASTEDIIICGHLYELIGLPRISKREWRSRFFWLTTDGLLHCGPSPRHRDVASIDVKELATVQEEDSARMEFALIGSLGKSLAVLRARSEEEYRLWLDTLSKVILETTTELDGDGDIKAMESMDEPQRGKALKAVSPVSPNQEESAPVSKEAVDQSPSFPLHEKVMENHECEPDSTNAEVMRQSSQQHMEIVEDIDIEVFTVSISSPESHESSPRRSGDQSPIKFQPSRASSQTTRSAMTQNVDEQPQEATLLQRIFHRNEPLLLAYTDKQSEFRAANRRIHEAKLGGAISQHHDGFSNGPRAVQQPIMSFGEDRKLTAEYGELWHALRKHPEVVASIGACQRTGEARKVFAATLVTAFLDPCSVPVSMCLQQVIAHCAGTAFERSLCDAVAGYRRYQAYGRILIGIILHERKMSGLRVEDVLDFMMDILRTSCPSEIKLLGRAFLTSLIVSTIQLNFDQIVFSDTARQVIDVVEARSSQDFESTVKSLLQIAPDNSATNENGFPVVGLEEWDILVCSRLDLVTFHMAVSQYPYALPDNVYHCLKRISGMSPPTGISQPFLLIEHGPRFVRHGNAEPELEFLRQVREHLANQSVTDEDDVEGTDDKALIREILALAERARMDMHLLDNSIRRIAKFDEEFKQMNTSLWEPRFAFAERPMVSPKGDEPAQNPPPSPAASASKHQASPRRTPSGVQTSPVFGPVNVDWETSSSGSERRVRSEEARRRRNVTTSPQSTASVEYASRTRSQTAQPLSAGASVPQYKPWVCPSNTRSFHV